VSKAFTKEDDEAGFAPPSGAPPSVPRGPFRLTARGARLLRERGDPHVAEALARAEIVGTAGDRDRAAIGVTVRVRTDTGDERTYRIVSAEERSLVGEGCSVESPIGRALLGARVGDVCEVTIPRGKVELEVIALEHEE
jgi:transcription elongation GreA/GreB family factor